MPKQKQKLNPDCSAEKNNAYRIWKLMGRISAAAVVILFIGYIISVNSLSVQGFVLQELKNKTKQLEAESNNIELNIMSMETFENINQRAQKMKMVKNDKIDYVLSGAVGVAKK